MIADDCFANPGQKNSSTVSNSMSDYDSEWWWVTHSYYTIYPDMQKVYELAHIGEKIALDGSPHFASLVLCPP